MVTHRVVILKYVYYVYHIYSFYITYLFPKSIPHLAKLYADYYNRPPEGDGRLCFPPWGAFSLMNICSKSLPHVGKE